MKRSIKRLFVILTIFMSFALVQGVWADEIIVPGIIERIGMGSIDVVDDNDELYTFYHIPFTSLVAASISLEVGDVVTIKAYVVIFPNETTKYIAYSITAEGTTYSWHPNAPRLT